MAHEDPPDDSLLSHWWIVLIFLVFIILIIVLIAWWWNRSKKSSRKRSRADRLKAEEARANAIPEYWTRRRTRRPGGQRLKPGKPISVAEHFRRTESRGRPRFSDSFLDSLDVKGKE